MLLTNKTLPTYRRAFQALYNIIPNAQPTSLMCDFEMAPRTAFHEIWGACTISGCLFHLSQNILGHVKSLGLAQYLGEPNFHAFVRYLTALAFLDEGAVPAAFDMLVHQQGFPEHIMPLYNYFGNTYIGMLREDNTRTAPLFPVPAWNMHNRVAAELARTNNSIEGWHSGMNSSIPYTHPAIWKFIRHLIAEDTLQRFNYTLAVRGEVPRRKQEYIRVDRNIQNLMARYHQIPQIEFIRGIAHNLQHYV